MLVAGCGSGGPGVERGDGVLVGSTAALDAVASQGPEGIYARVCGYCHGANVGPVLLGRGLPAETIHAIVRNGMNAMPAFRESEITDDELQALAQWIEQSDADPQEHGN
ncbi:c-type cytochrome [Parasphingopyxis marina]|uniref:c-type cytochrome n=1 Tax=Parasphingopyxis marina TaxID=2761622 RepID=UPI002E2CA1E4|nr:cytochrome c [Parasphingopyxis marina]